MMFQDYLSHLKRNPTSLDIACLEMFHVAREYEFKTLPASVHIHLSDLPNVSQRYVSNPNHINEVLITLKEIEEVVDKNIFLDGAFVGPIYRRLKSSADFHMNFGALRQAIAFEQQVAFSDELTPKRKAELDLVAACSLGAAMYSKKASRSTDAMIYSSIADNPEFYFDLLTAFHGFKKQNPDFKPSEKLWVDFEMAYVNSLVQMEVDKKKRMAGYN